MPAPVRALRLLLPRRVRLGARAAAKAVRAHPRPPVAVLLGLAVLSLLLLAGTLQTGVRTVPPSAQVLPLLAGGLLLGRREMARLLVVVGVSVLCLYAFDSEGSTAALSTVVVVAAAAALSWASARSRDETGLGGTRGGSVLVELRTRLQHQGRMPALPRGWHAESVVRPAGGAPFSGDFLVSALTPTGCLELALVDVSGKGVDAGTRSLLLSGALGGLLASRAPADFLRAANAYLVRQDWDEGFATAVHLLLDLRTGAYALDSAGHPPVAHFDAGSGRWSLTDASGVALGLLPDVEYEAVHGRLDPGDALVLYTDGLVEIPGRDLSVGIDKLLGEAERLVPRGFVGGADRLVTLVAGSAPDDRGLVLLWRTS